MAAALDREVHAARAAEEVAELEAGLADRRIVDDGQETGRVRHDGAVEERLVVVEQVHQVDVAVDVGVLVPELQR